jgi:hypothetical protein
LGRSLFAKIAKRILAKRSGFQRHKVAASILNAGIGFQLGKRFFDSAFLASYLTVSKIRLCKTNFIFVDI